MYACMLKIREQHKHLIISECVSAEKVEETATLVVASSYRQNR